MIYGLDGKVQVPPLILSFAGLALDLLDKQKQQQVETWKHAFLYLLRGHKQSCLGAQSSWRRQAC